MAWPLKITPFFAPLKRADAGDYILSAFAGRRHRVTTRSKDPEPASIPSAPWKGLFSGRADLENDSPMRALIVLAVPSVGLFLFNSLLALVDTIFVSRLGELPMAAMSFTQPVNLCIFATLECVGGGAAALMGRHLGRHDSESARLIARSALALLYLVCLLSAPMILPPVSGAVFGAIGAGGDPELLRLCWLYTLWTPIMLPFGGYTYIANTTARAQGDTLTPFKAIALANTVNLILDPLFIFTFGWGISGAAAATCLSRVAAVLYLLWKMPRISAIPVPPLLHPRTELRTWWGPILRIGLPIALTTASVALGMGGTNGILMGYGHRAVSAWMLGMRVEDLAFNFLFGLYMALIPYVAYNYGRRDLERMTAGLRSALLLGLILMGTIGTVIAIWPHPFLGLFNPPKETGEMAIRAIRASVPSYPCSVFIMLAGAFFVGIGQSLYGTLVQILRSIVFRISAAWLFFHWFAPEHIWWFQSLAALLGSLAAAAFLALVLKRLKQTLRPERETKAIMNPKETTFR